jgi:hypothetical protein
VTSVSAPAPARRVFFILSIALAAAPFGARVGNAFPSARPAVNPAYAAVLRALGPAEIGVSPRAWRPRVSVLDSAGRARLRAEIVERVAAQATTTAPAIRFAAPPTTDPTAPDTPPIPDSLRAGMGYVTAGDLDGDGRDDVVGIALDDSALVVRRNLGGGSYAARVTYALATGAWRLTLADLNGDHRPDVVVVNIANAPAHQYSVLLNAGDGTFGSRHDGDLSQVPADAVAVDLGPDGRMDLVFPMLGFARVDLVVGLGDGTFLPASSLKPIAADDDVNGCAVGAGDLDGDGFTDLALVYDHGDCYDSGCQTLSLYFGRAGGSFDEPVMYQAYEGGGRLMAKSVTMGDLDGDHAMDLVVGFDAEYGPAPLPSWIRNSGARAFEAPSVRDVSQSPWILKTAHLRAGVPDLVYSDLVSVYLLRNQGPGVFAPEEPIAGGALLEVADLNADGWSDLVIGRADTVEVRLGDGAGQFAGPTVEFIGSFLAVADFTGDHRPDLSVILPNGHAGVLAGDGLGGFASPVDWGPTPLDGNPQTPYRAVDLDGDGRADLVAARSGFPGNDTLSVSWNEGGAFANAVMFDAGPTKVRIDDYSRPMDVACGDFDGDGLLDLAVVKGDGEAGIDGFLTSIHNLGHRALGPPQALLAASEDPLTAVVADFDGDGRADLALADVMTDFTGRFLVFQGQDDGSLTEIPGPSWLGGYAVHHWAFSIASGDFNGDGRSDVAVGCGIPTFRDGSTVIVVPNVTPLLGPTPVLAALVSVDAQPDRVSLTWNVGGSRATAAIVERRTPSTNWASLEQLHPDGQGRLGFEDRAVDAGARYGYRLALEGATSAQSTTTETWVDVPRSVAFAISGASPNPTRGPLFVRMTLPTGDPVRLELLDVTGRRVRERTITAPMAGAQSFALSDRAPLDPGVYFVRATQGPRSASARVAVVR